MKTISSIKLEGLTTEVGCHDDVPLPWGTVNVETCRISGRLHSTRGGAWYWRLPEDAIIGYGEFCPYVDFYFSGRVERTSRRDDIPEDGWGMRIGDRCWLYLEGEISPCWLKRLENLLVCDQFGVNSEKAQRQGHLTVEDISMTPARLVAQNFPLWKDTGHQMDLLTRRKIYNHQFFGDCRIFFVDDRRYRVEPWVWLVYCVDSTWVVSPDHPDDPILLSPGWYRAEHPVKSYR